MSPLFDAGRHHQLDAESWTTSAARRAIDDFIRDAERDFRGPALWPIHPIDRSPERATTLKTLYYGAAGMIWSLSELGAEPTGAADILALARSEARREASRLNPDGLSSFLMAEAGFALLQAKFGAGSVDLYSTLEAALEAHPTGIVWGRAGALLAARFARALGDHASLEDLIARGASTLRDARDANGLWTTELNGHRDQMLSALHGYCANMGTLLRVAPDPSLIDSARTVLSAHAVRGAEGVNWPLTAGPSTRAPDLPLLLQFCNGPPGVIVMLGGLLGDDFDNEFLLAAGELIWRAGPPTKLPSLCHGAPGSGYAFLRLFETTGDALWLERARAFAMHAVRANGRCIREHGQRKYSLWTGDAGLALYLRACLDADPAFPTLDRL